MRYLFRKSEFNGVPVVVEYRPSSAIDAIKSLLFSGGKYTVRDMRKAVESCLRRPVSEVTIARRIRDLKHEISISSQTVENKRYKKFWCSNGISGRPDPKLVCAIDKSPFDNKGAASDLEVAKKTVGKVVPFSCIYSTNEQFASSWLEYMHSTGRPVSGDGSVFPCVYVPWMYAHGHNHSDVPSASGPSISVEAVCKLVYMMREYVPVKSIRFQPSWPNNFAATEVSYGAWA